MNQPVKMYTLSTCGHCKSAKKFMFDHNIRHEFTDVDLLVGEERKAVLDEIRRYNPNCSFPTILIGDRVLVGYNEKNIIEALDL